MNGLFIVLEGPEGSGKSTQGNRLAAHLRIDDIPVLLTREPGGTSIGEHVRTILLDRANYAMLPQTEALLYSAARAQHVGEVIRPALESGMLVICDRYVDSTLAYQSGGRGLPLDGLAAMQQFATGGLSPDLRLLLDLPPALGLARRLATPEEVNRLDVASLAFHERVREYYLSIVDADPASWQVIDASGNVEEVAANVLSVVAPKIEAWRKSRASLQRGGDVSSVQD